jgi:uncharacterized membrane protein
VPRRGLAATRLAFAGAAGLAALVGTLAANVPWGVALTAAWCGGSFVWLGWVWSAIGRKSAAETKEHARANDGSRATSDLVLLSASVASLVAVGYTLVYAGNRSSPQKGLTIGLAILAIALAWGAVHTIYTLRYAALFYGDPVGGIDFNGEDGPDYLDLTYFAFTVGMTFQVSDTDVKAKAIRRTVLRHALLSYLFGAVIVAVTINLVASLLNG